MKNYTIKLKYILITKVLGVNVVNEPKTETITQKATSKLNAIKIVARTIEIAEKLTNDIYGYIGTIETKDLQFYYNNRYIKYETLQRVFFE